MIALTHWRWNVGANNMRMTRKVMMNIVRRLWTQCAPDVRSSNLPKRAEHRRLCCERLPWKRGTDPGRKDRATCGCRWRSENGRHRQEDTYPELEHLSDTCRGPAAQGGRDLQAQDCQGRLALMQTISCQGELPSFSTWSINMILMAMG